MSGRRIRLGSPRPTTPTPIFSGVCRVRLPAPPRGLCYDEAAVAKAAVDCLVKHNAEQTYEYYRSKSTPGRVSRVTYSNSDLYWVASMLGEKDLVSMSDPYLDGHVAERHFDNPQYNKCVFADRSLIAPLVHATLLYGRLSAIQRCKAGYRVSIQKTWPYLVGLSGDHPSDAMLAVVALNRCKSYLVSSYVTGGSNETQAKKVVTLEKLNLLPDTPTILPSRIVYLLTQLRTNKLGKSVEQCYLGKRFLLHGRHDKLTNLRMLDGRVGSVHILSKHRQRLCFLGSGWWYLSLK